MRPACTACLYCPAVRRAALLRLSLLGSLGTTRPSWQAGRVMEHPSGLVVDEHVSPDRRAGDPVVVLVHGSLDRASSFSRVIRRLPDLHTIAYDRRGYHRSRDVTPLADTLDGHIDDLFAVIGGRPAVVIGHSFGGTITLGAALRNEQGSTIQAIATYEPPMPWLSIPGARPSAGSTIDNDPTVVSEQFYRRVVGNSSWERLSEAAQEERRGDGPALAAEIRSIRGDHPPFDARCLTLPAVFGRGGHSNARQRGGVQRLVDHVVDSELIEFPDSGHGAHLSHPDAFANLV
ncbi:MAG: alpha/beta hydrolase, partial [Acidimicrobiales bacterium]